MTDKKRVTLYLSDEEKQALKRLADQQGRSMSSQARISVMNDVRSNSTQMAVTSSKE